MRVYFTVVFYGGHGTVKIEISRRGKVVKTLDWDSRDRNDTDQKWTELDPGFHTISATGVSAPGGTDLTIHKRTRPETPERIKAGVITNGYTMTLIDEA